GRGGADFGSPFLYRNGGNRHRVRRRVARRPAQPRNAGGHDRSRRADRRDLHRCVPGLCTTGGCRRLWGHTGWSAPGGARVRSGHMLARRGGAGGSPAGQPSITRGGAYMRKVTAFESLTLDGVMQAPGRPDEDPRGGFEHGGGALSYSDPVMGQVAGASMAAAPDLLFGRRTYEDFYSVWPNRTDNP